MLFDLEIQRHIETLQRIKRFLRGKQINYNIYGLSNEYLESPSDEVANAIYEHDQKELENIICYLQEKASGQV